MADDRPTQPEVDTNPVVSKIVGGVRQWEDEARQWISDFQEFDEMYRGTFVSPQDNFGSANTSSLEFHRIVESVASAVSEIIFADEPFFRVKSSQLLDEGRRKKARVGQAVLEKQARQADVRINTVDGLRDQLINGTVFYDHNWVFDERWAADTEGGVKRVPLLDFWNFEPIPAWRFSFDVGGTTVQNAEWVVKEEDATEERVRGLVEMFKSLKVPDFRDFDALDLTVPATSTEGRRKTDEIRRDRIWNETSRHKNRPFVIKHYWGLHPTDTDLRRKGVVYYVPVINDADYIGIAPNPYPHGLKPFTSCPLIKLKESMYGWGLGHLLKKKHIEIIERDNLMQDLINIAIYGVWIQRGGSVGFDTIKLKPGMVLNTGRYGEIEHKTPQLGVLAPAFNFTQSAKDDMRVSAGATSTVQAIVEGETATETKIVAAEAARRLIGMARQFVGKITRPALWMGYESTKKFLDKPTLVEITNDEGAVKEFMASGKDLIPDVEVEMTLAANLENKPRMVRELRQTLSDIASLLPVTPGIVSVLPAAIQRLFALQGVPMKEPPRVQVVQQPPATPPGSLPPEVPPGGGI